jgi:hypothetical protein
MEIYDRVKNSSRVKSAVDFIVCRDLSPGDYQILVWDAMKDKNIAEELMYVLHAPNLGLGYRKNMEEGFSLINEGKLKGELMN